jgi:MtfA peptidase
MGFYVPALIVVSVAIATIKRNTLWLRSLPNHQKLIIQKYFRHYNLYSQADKKLFEKRVHKFVRMKQFIPRGGIEEVTDEMKILIASTAIQITFGYPKVYFKHFERILVYPDDYYSTITKKKHQGEVNMNGIIVFSWKHFMEGFMDDTNGRNLGYHEMAHALKLENALRNGEYNFLDYDSLVKFTYQSELEMKKIANGNTTFFRQYAATNKHEFMAIVVENFFERPVEFREYNKALYDITAKLLKQNPLVRKSNYIQ